MSMKKSLVGVGLALVTCLVMTVPAAAQANVGGTWEITIEGPEGPANATATLQQDGMTFTGTITVAQAEGAEIANGKIEGSTMSFQLIVSVQGAELVLDVQGEVTGDSITGQMSVPDFGGFPFTAERTAS
jgi:hypothetical protein